MSRDASPERRRPLAVDPLHKIGYRIHRGAVKGISDDVIQELSRQALRNAKPIFNGVDTKRKNEDRKRAQFQPQGLDSFLQGITEFLAAVIPSHLRQNNWVAIQSKSKCHNQPAHCDFMPTPDLVKATDEQMPLAALVALMPGTRLNVWPNSIRLITQPDLAEQVGQIARQTVELNAGDVLLFRADTVHAGASYDEYNLRLHCFLDSEYVARDPDTTWVIHRDEGEGVRNAIMP